MFGACGDGSADDTKAVQACFDFWSLYSTRYTLHLYGLYHVSKVTISPGSYGLIRSDAALFYGLSTAAQTCVFEIMSPGVVIDGKLVVSAGRRMNYEVGFHYWHPTAAQFSTLSNVIVNDARVGFRFGHISYPGALISEITLNSPQTYGCPVAMDVIGGEAFVSIVSPQLSGDSFGGDTSWCALPKCVIRNRGATVMVHGGECINTADPNGMIFNMVPIDRGNGRVEWGTLSVTGTTVESASPLCVIDNLGMPINNAASWRRGEVNFSKLIGYHSQDIAPLISVCAAYNDIIKVNGMNLWHPGTVRTQPNIYCVSGSRAEIMANGGFGQGFPYGLGGIVGGTVNFSRREVLRATGLNGQSFTAGAGFQTANFTTVQSNNDRARWVSCYSNGVFSIPVGALGDVVATVSIRLSGATTGWVILRSNNVEVIRAPLVSGCANLVHSLGDVGDGVPIDVLIDVDTNDTGISQASANVFSLSAKRGEVN